MAALAAAKVEVSLNKNKKNPNPVCKREGESKMQYYDEIGESLMAAAKVKISQKKKKNPAELDRPFRFVRPEWFSHPIYWSRDKICCIYHDEICEQVESILRVLDPSYPFPHSEEDEEKNKQEDEQLDMDLNLVFDQHPQEEEKEVESVLLVLDPNYPFPHSEEEEEKKNKQEDEQLDTDLTLLFDPHPQVEAKEEVRPQQLGGKLEEPRESHKKIKKKKNKQKNKNKKEKQQENDMKEEDNNNIQKNKEQKEEKKKNDANIIKYRPPPKDGLWNIQVGEKYEFIWLLFSKLRDYIKYSGHQESHKKSKKKNKNKKEKQQEEDNKNIQKNKEQKEEKKNDADIIKYRPPPKDGPWNIQGGEKYEFIRLLFSKLRDYLIKYNGHQVRPQQLGDKFEEPQEESHKKSKKKKNKNKQQEDNNNNIQKNKDQKEEGKNNANIIKYRPPTQDGLWNIQEGKKYNVIPLLFSKLRDYLIKYDGHQVKSQQLNDKYILLYFWWLSDDRSTLHEDGICFGLDEYLGEIYRAYNPKGRFEVVFVALGNNERAFHDSFSCMPWLAIPHEDQEGRDLFINMFDIPSSPSVSAALFAPDGTALLEYPHYTFCSYGPNGFPFTKQRIYQMHREHDALLKEFISKKQKPSLTALFGDYLISSEEKQVCTSVLEDKIVGLYFFGTSLMDFQRAEKLLNIWKFMKTSEAYKNFEIVLINKAFDGNLQLAKARFKDKFGDIPWYSLPLIYNKKCCQVFQVSSIEWKMRECFFIVLEPDRYQCLSYFGFGILDKFGIDAYPFTLEKAVGVEKSIQRKQLVLSQLLSPSAPLRRGGSTCNDKEDTTVSMISWKRILLLFATQSCYECGSFLPKLKKMYDESKGIHDQFEVIYISLDCVESPSSFPRGIQRMPWLIHAYAPRFAADLAKRVFGVFPRLPAIAAFGPNGYLETKESNLAFKEVWNSKYPFIQADMDEEVCRELMDMYKWDLEDLFPRILSKRKLDVP